MRSQTPDFRKLPVRDRILLYSHIDKMGCWIWQKNTFRNTGYAQITHNKKVYLGHRLSMFLFKNFDLSSKHLVLHHCDVKRCLNPAHLYIGDRFDNARDAVERRLQLSGSRHPMAKLNEAKVKNIKILLRNGDDIKKIASRYRVSNSTIALIRRQKIWTHVKEK